MEYLVSYCMLLLATPIYLFSFLRPPYSTRSTSTLVQIVSCIAGNTSTRTEKKKLLSRVNRRVATGCGPLSTSWADASISFWTVAGVAPEALLIDFRVALAKFTEN